MLASRFKRSPAASPTVRRAVSVALAALLMVVAGQGTAATLYRWVEPDGTPTFSPNKPPAGVDFTLVDTAAMSKDAVADSSALPDASPVARPAADAEAVAGAAASTGAQAIGGVTTAPALRTPAATDSIAEQASGLSYAPAPGSTRSRLDSGITASTAPAASDAASSTEATGDPVTASTEKYAQCQELEKRVISLERRLRSPLTPEEMDNTVIYMARYQDSVDRFCRS